MGKPFIDQQLWKTILVCALLISSTSYGAEIETTHSLFMAIDERLAYMEDVALFKAQNHIPIEDVAREQVVLEDAKELAATLGLYPRSMEQFFVAQINAAKAIQYRYRAELLTLGLPGRTIDLDSTIRPELDRLGIEIVRLFAEFLRAGNTLVGEHREPFTQALRSDYLTQADKSALFDAMSQVRLAR